MKAILQFVADKYGSRFEILRAGSYVNCAVTGERIALDDLKYWNCELQEPYASAEAALRRRLALIEEAPAATATDDS